MIKPVLLLDPLSPLDVDHLVELKLLLVGVLGPIDHSGTILLSQGQSLKLPGKQKVGIIMSHELSIMDRRIVRVTCLKWLPCGHKDNSTHAKAYPLLLLSSFQFPT